MAFWINIHGCQPYPRNSPLCTKSAQKWYLLLGTIGLLFAKTFNSNWTFFLPRWKTGTKSLVGSSSDFSDDNFFGFPAWNFQFAVKIFRRIEQRYLAIKTWFFQKNWYVDAINLFFFDMILHSFPLITQISVGYQIIALHLFDIPIKIMLNYSPFWD